MDPKRDHFQSSKISASAPANPMGMSLAAPPVARNERPVVGQGVTEYFVPFAGEADDVKYHPALLREAHVHFTSRKAGLEGSRLIRFVNPMGGKSIDWSTDSGCTIPVKSLDDAPRKGVDFAELPGYAMNKNNYRSVEEEFEDWIYRNERVKLIYSPHLQNVFQAGRIGRGLPGAFGSERA